MAELAGVPVRVRDLTKRYGAVEAVRSVSFDIEPGEIFGLLGPNGAGKTTTLECLVGLRQPDGGEILVGGLDVRSRRGDVRRLVGAQLQSAALQDQITPREALTLFRSFHPRGSEPAALIDQFGLADCADARFRTLSGGQQQRLFLALALVNDPPLLVLDEPTAGLDPASRRQLHELINDLRRAGRTVLLTTHDLDEASRLCTRIAIIDHGRTIAVAPPGELLRGTRATGRIEGTTRRPLPEAEALGLAGVVHGALRGEHWVIHTTAVAPTLVALVKLLDREGNELVDLQVRPPSLEDVFIELTGRAWIADAGEATR